MEPRAECKCTGLGATDRDGTFFNCIKAAIGSPVRRFTKASGRETGTLCPERSETSNNNSLAKSSEHNMTDIHNILLMYQSDLCLRTACFPPCPPTKPLGLGKSKGMASLCVTKWNDLLQASQHRPGCLPHIAFSDAPPPPSSSS